MFIFRFLFVSNMGNDLLIRFWHNINTYPARKRQKRSARVCDDDDDDYDDDDDNDELNTTNSSICHMICINEHT